MLYFGIFFTLPEQKNIVSTDVFCASEAEKTTVFTVFLAPFKLSWGHLGALGAILRILVPSWDPSWGYVGPSWGHVGPSWACVGPSSAMLAYLRAHVGPSEGYVGPSCPYFGALAHLEPQKRKKSPK